nr:hypothetical protein GCM10025732_09510 [Glycomyces mayteni]
MFTYGSRTAESLSHSSAVRTWSAPTRAAWRPITASSVVAGSWFQAVPSDWAASHDAAAAAGSANGSDDWACAGEAASRVTGRAAAMSTRPARWRIA